MLGWGGWIWWDYWDLVLVVGGVAVMEGVVVWGRTPWPPRYPHPSPLPPSGEGTVVVGGEYCC